MRLENGLQLGSYRIVDFIGRGGMAEVYKAYQPALERYVAIKVLPGWFAEEPGSLERFYQEARSIARLNHPNIVRIFDSMTVGDITFLALEFVDGRGLEEFLGQALDLEAVLGYLRPIAGAIDHAHSQQVLHRDIKPSNILIRHDGTPMLTDFGLAQPTNAANRLTVDGAVAGTPAYMSPEQARGEAAGPKSDLYALAVVAYEMLTGRTPFYAESAIAMLFGHLNSSVPATPELSGELAAHLESVLRRGMAKAPEDRYDSARAFVKALEPAVWARHASSADLPGVSISRRRQQVLVVDDSVANRELIEASLAGVDCEIRMAGDGRTALEMVAEREPDLVLLDVEMPGADGHDVCRQIKSTPDGRLIPVVMVTALQGVDDRIRALESGADDFLSKPVDRSELLARVRSMLRLKAVYDTLDNAQRVIYALAAAVDARDPYTERHAERVAAMAKRIGSQIGLSDAELDDLFRGALIHDIGKIGIPDAILLKPGPLTDEEAAQMQLHTVIGAQIVSPLHSSTPLLSVVRNHHEHVDGTGYPDGLAGESISMAARIVAVCDAYDALVSARPYRPRRSAVEAASVLQGGAGTQWDAEIVTSALSLPAVWAAV